MLQRGPITWMNWSDRSQNIIQCCSKQHSIGLQECGIRVKMNADVRNFDDGMQDINILARMGLAHFNKWDAE